MTASSEARGARPEIDLGDTESVIRALAEKNIYIADRLQCGADLVTLIDMVYAMAQRPEKEPGLSSCIWEVRDIAHVIHGARRERFTWDIAHRFVETSPTLMRLADVPGIVELQARVADLLGRWDR